MKITVNKDEIIDGLMKAASIIPAKAGAQYIRSIWLKAESDKICVMSSDANIEFTGTYKAEVEDGGIVGVQGRAFVDLIRQLPSGNIQMLLDATTGNLQIKQGRRRYTLPVSNAEWFQDFSEYPENNSVMWSGDFFVDLLDKVVFCISDDDPVEAITCLCIKPRQNGRIDVCGLNGHQFALVSLVHDDLAARLPPEGILLQKKYVQDIKKLVSTDDIELNITDKRLYLRNVNKAEVLSLPRAVYDFPDYGIFMGRIEDDDVQSMNIDRKEFMDSLSRILLFNTVNDPCTYVYLSREEVRLSAQGQDVGTADENLEISYAGNLERIAFPTKNLLDILGHFDSPRVDLMLTESEGPCGIRGADDGGYTVIIMPMKIIDANENYYEEDV